MPALDAASAARRFLAACGGSSEGGRDNRTFEVACAIIERFDLDTDTLVSLMLGWNLQSNNPALTDREVTERVRSALRTTAYDPDKAVRDPRTNGHRNGHTNGHRRPARPPEPPAAPLPTAEELDRARDILANSNHSSARAAREYLSAYGITPASCGWGLGMVHDDEASALGLSRAAEGVRLLIPVYLPTGELGDVRRYRGPFGSGSDADKVLPWAKGHGTAKPYGWWPAPDADELVWCEGEKDREALTANGIPAVSHTCGASSGRKVAEELPAELLAERRFVLLFDHDEAGRQAADKLAATLLSRGATVRVATWPDLLPDGTTTPTGFDAADWFKSGYSLDLLRVILHESTAVEPAEERTQIVVSGRQLREKAADALQALVDANDPPALFVRGGQLVRVSRDERQWPVLSPVGEAALRGLMAEAADWLKVVATDTGPRGVATDPPPAVVQTVLTAPTWPFPPVESITQVPTLRPDGSIHATPGYDPVTRTVYVPPDGLTVPDVPMAPTRAQVAKALEIVRRPWAEFPFADDASEANLLGLLLTAVVRTAIKGPVPLALIEAPQAGTGKSLICDGIGIVATGRAEFTTAPATREEWPKEIGTQLMAGRAIVAFDNCEGRLDNPDLAAVLTMEMWTKRQLGTNTAPPLAQRAVWIATGNNVRLGGDLPRRCYLVRLDARTSRPWQRDGFAITDLRAYLRANRGELLAALLTLARAWYSAGQPPAPVKPLGSFEHWTVVVAGILHHAGVTGFLSNLEEMYQTSDEDGPVLEGFLRALAGCFGRDAFTSKAVVARFHEGGQTRIDGDADRILRDAVPEYLIDKGDELNTIRLGKLLRSNAGRRFGADNIRVERAGDEGHTKVARWCIRHDDPNAGSGSECGECDPTTPRTTNPLPDSGTTPIAGSAGSAKSAIAREIGEGVAHDDPVNHMYKRGRELHAPPATGTAPLSGSGFDDAGDGEYHSPHAEPLPADDEDDNPWTLDD